MNQGGLFPKTSRISPNRPYDVVDVVEEAAGVLGLDLLLDPPVGGEVRDVGLIGRACAAGGDSDDATIPGEDDGPGVARIGKLAVRLVVRNSFPHPSTRCASSTAIN